VIALAGNTAVAEAVLVGPEIDPVTESEDAIAAAHAEDILGIYSVMQLPARIPLHMEAVPPVYLRPRDALTGLQRLFGAAGTAL
jgi:hypothetical protein